MHHRAVSRNTDTRCWAEMWGTVNRGHLNLLLSVSRAAQTLLGPAPVGAGYRACISGDVTDEMWMDYIANQTPPEPDDNFYELLVPAKWRTDPALCRNLKPPAFSRWSIHLIGEQGAAQPSTRLENKTVGVRSSPPTFSERPARQAGRCCRSQAAYVPT